MHCPSTAPPAGVSMPHCAPAQMWRQSCCSKQSGAALADAYYTCAERSWYSPLFNAASAELLAVECCICWKQPLQMFRRMTSVKSSDSRPTTPPRFGRLVRNGEILPLAPRHAPLACRRSTPSQHTVDVTEHRHSTPSQHTAPRSTPPLLLRSPSQQHTVTAHRHSTSSQHTTPLARRLCCCARRHLPALA